MEINNNNLVTSIETNRNIVTIEEGIVPQVSNINVIKTKENPTKSKLFKCLQISSGCILCILLIALIAASTSYYVFSIMSLTEISNKTVQNRCSNSNLWSYLLTVLIINIVVLDRAKKGTKDNDTGGTIIGSIISFIIMVSLCAWGSIEFWNSCVQDKLSNTLLFKMVEVTIYLQYSVIAIIIIIIIKLCGNISSDVKKTVNTL